jgi:hypothetical protein
VEKPEGRPHSAGAAAQAWALRCHEQGFQRPGTTTLFAGLNVLEGTVIGPCMQRHRHRHEDFIRFLDASGECQTGRIIKDPACADRPCCKAVCAPRWKARAKGGGRHFEGETVLWAVRWYCRYGISYRDLEQMMAERGVSVDHSTIYRWVQRYAPEIEKRLRWHWRRHTHIRR